MKKGELIELNITQHAFEGKGLAKAAKDEKGLEKNYVVFVYGSYPGDTVLAKIRKVKKSYAEATVEKIIIPSPLRTDPRCKYFGVCGGCKQQDLIYEKQLLFKQEQVEDIFEQQTGLGNFITDKIIPSNEQYYYRNKMEFSFSDLRWLTEDELDGESKADRNFALGLHVPRIYDKVLDINECFLQSESSNKILNFTREFFKSRNTSIYSTKTHTGYLRNLVIRLSQHTNDFMVNLVTSEENESLIKEYTSELIKEVPGITTVVNNINKKKASVATGDYQKVFLGSGFIYDEIGKYKFRISSNSFFQTNTLQAEKLYRKALEFAELEGNEVVYDLYSGAGTIAIYISEFAKQVIGFESVEPSIYDANENAEINKVANVQFVQANLYKSFLPGAVDLPKPDVVILDPPRSGMHKNTIADILELGPKKIVYVSCNPATQVRDIEMMVRDGYRLIKIQPIDMFPHTYHIENVALLIK